MEISALYQLYLQYPRISTDTRSALTDTLFFALRGSRFNGNTFAAQALEQGAARVIIDDEAYYIDERTILVDDALRTLQDLALYKRRQFDIPFIGLTGSNGKTTSKELLSRVLAQKYRVHATRGNLNNHIGVPLTLLEMPADTQIAVIEMGANRVGDIAELCQICRPTHGFITNIGYAHIEGFGGYEGVLRGKTELYQFLRENAGQVFINAGDEVLSNMAKRFANPILFGKDSARIEMVEANPFLLYRDPQGERIQTALLGSYNLGNIQVAAAIGKYFELTWEQINTAIATYAPTNNRSEFVAQSSRNNQIVLDAYNANPSSMQVALENFENIQTDRPKIAILGDMYELGVATQKEHRQLIETALSLKIDTLLFCGSYFKNAQPQHSPILVFETKDELEAYLSEKNITGSLVLLKGSRKMGLETLTAYL
jgi:UDP-N-acetylmuramoyl-tripeptide--D-alanyl-D-alanine ligase